jgi:peptidoglycan/xylan/chitin deacetylase (PgdA/CDA1 family)
MIGLLAGGVSLSLATAAAWQMYAPRSQFYGRTFIGTPGVGRKLALTFDDGPNPACTPQLLEVLARHNVRATFFLIGRWVEQQPELARAVQAAGHEVGNHTYNHPNLALCSADRVRQELSQAQGAMENAGLTNPRQLFRPPFGARRPATLRTARSLGYNPVNWTVTTYDWKPTTAERIEQHVHRQLKGGDVLLFHDGGHRDIRAERMHTVRAVERLIPFLKDHGHEFVTIGDWLTSSDAANGSR